ncbi:hypothetical protein TIFTF001_055451, partial [Ficus carica]
MFTNNKNEIKYKIKNDMRI